MLYDKIVLTCFINGTSAMVEDTIAVSPSGEALSPNKPQAEPIKYNVAHPIKNITIGINIAGTLWRNYQE